MEQYNLDKMLFTIKKSYNDKQNQIKKRDSRKLRIKEKKKKVVKETESKYDPL